MKILLANVRTQKNRSLRQLERDSGVSKSHISNIENGCTMPSIDVLYKLAKALGVPITDLFDGEDN